MKRTRKPTKAKRAATTPKRAPARRAPAPPPPVPETKEAREARERAEIAKARERIERQAITMLGGAYKLDDAIARDLAGTIAKNYGLRAEAEAVLGALGLMCFGGKNGAPYANPMIAVVQKTTELIERLLDRLEQYKIDEADEPLEVKAA